MGAAMKGAFDGGLEIPHNEKKFYGYDADEKEYDAEANRERILGGHVAQYMNSLEEEEDKYLEVHKKIRESPEHVPTEKKKPTGDALMKEKREGGIRYTDEEGNEKFINRMRRTLAQRKNRVAQKKAFVLSTLAGDDDDDEEEDEE